MSVQIIFYFNFFYPNLRLKQSSVEINYSGIQNQSENHCNVCGDYLKPRFRCFIIVCVGQCPTQTNNLHNKTSTLSEKKKEKQQQEQDYI